MSFKERLFSFFVKKDVKKCLNASPSGIRQFPLFKDPIDREKFIHVEDEKRIDVDSGWEIVSKK